MKNKPQRKTAIALNRIATGKQIYFIGLNTKQWIKGEENDHTHKKTLIFEKDNIMNVRFFDNKTIFLI